MMIEKKNCVSNLLRLGFNIKGEEEGDESDKNCNSYERRRYE